MGALLAVRSLFRLISTTTAILERWSHENSCYTPHNVTEIQSKCKLSLQPLCKLSIQLTNATQICLSFGHTLSWQNYSSRNNGYSSFPTHHICKLFCLACFSLWVLPQISTSAWTCSRVLTPPVTCLTSD